MSYAGEWIGAPVVIGLVVFLCVPSFALLGLAFVVVIAAGVLVALVGASVAAPYLLARHVRRRWLSRGIDGRRAWAPVDRVLELFKRDRLSATELRVLLELRGRRDVRISELAEALAGRPADIRRAGRQLDMRGLVRQWHAGRTEQTLLAITPAGLAPMRALLAAAPYPAAAPDAAKAPVR